MKQLPLVINLRGNSGSGKTYTTRRFMELCVPAHTPLNTAFDGSDQLLRFGMQSWAILGRYSNACGGCDTIKTQQEVVDRIEFYTSFGYNVWAEGLIMSTIYGTVGAYSEKFGDRWVFAYLDTPIEACIKRIRARRKEAGNTKPLNETNTRNRVSTIERNREIVSSHGRRTITLDGSNALPALLKIIKKEGKQK